MTEHVNPSELHGSTALYLTGHVEMSEAIVEIATALAKAQGAMGHASKETKNTHFNNRYADLASVIDAAREPLAANGIAYVQFPGALTQAGIPITTTLLHSSGQWMRSTLVMPVVKRDPQGVGSAITYGRRYALMAMLGIAPDDDDGEAAMGRGNSGREDRRDDRRDDRRQDDRRDARDGQGRQSGNSGNASGSAAAPRSGGLSQEESRKLFDELLAEMNKTETVAAMQAWAGGVVQRTQTLHHEDRDALNKAFSARKTFMVGHERDMASLDGSDASAQ